MRDNVQFAGFWRRAYADCVDSLILDGISLMLGAILLGVVFWAKVATQGRVSATGVELSYIDAIDPFWLQILFVVIRLGISSVYFVWGTYKFQTSIGKRFFKVYVVSAKSDKNDLNMKFENPSLSQSFIRFFAYSLSYLPLCAGFIMTAFNREKRALHDLIAGTACVINEK